MTNAEIFIGTVIKKEEELMSFPVYSIGIKFIKDGRETINHLESDIFGEFEIELGKYISQLQEKGIDSCTIYNGYRFTHTICPSDLFSDINGIQLLFKQNGIAAKALNYSYHY